MNKADEIRKKALCFTGHRKLEEPISEIIDRTTGVILTMIQNGYQYFYIGGAKGFDMLAAEIVLNLKGQYPEIHLILVLPFDELYAHEHDWTEQEINQYNKLKEQASNVIVLFDKYRPGVYYQRNRYLVDHSSICVAYLKRKNSGTGYTVNYARTQKLPILNIKN